MKQQHYFSVHSTVTMHLNDREPVKMNTRFARTLFPMMVLFVIAEGMGALMNWKAIQLLLYVERNRLSPGEFRVKPPVVLPGSHGVQFDAVLERNLTDMWQGTRDKNYKSFKDAPVLRNPVTLDGKDGEKECVPSAEWQSLFFPTCNSFHELGFRLAGVELEDVEEEEEYLEANEVDQEEENEKNLTDVERLDDDAALVGMADEYYDAPFMTLLGTGTSRDAWKVETVDELLVLKTFHLDRKFSHEAYRHQQLDSTVSEKLSSSKYVADIYGFCGLSVFNELGQHLEIRRRLPLKERLQYARDLAAGMRDAHSIDGAPNAMVVHADLRQNNVLLSYDTGSIKLSDFNQGSYLGKNIKRNEMCGYQPQFSFWHDRFAAPEECIGGVQTEKSDVYHMGGMIYYLLTGKKPYTQNLAEFKQRKETMSSRGEWPLPVLPRLYRETNDSVVATMRDAIEVSLRIDANERASAEEVFLMLDSMLSLLDRDAQED